MSDKEQPFPPELIEAEKSKRLAEARKFDAETRKLDAEAEQAEHAAATSRLARKKSEYDDLKRLTSDEFHHLYRFVGGVDGTTTKACMSQLSQWSRMSPKAPIEIVFSSPGGSIIDGLILWDYIQSLRTAEHVITTSTLGMAASMAGILLQAGDVRVMGKQSWLLIHEASFGASGSQGQVDDTVEWIKAIQDRILDIFANRSKMTKKAIKAKWNRKDWWIDADEALKLGLCDEIR